MIKKEDGQSLVEFALVLPLILIMLVGVVDFGRVLYAHLQLELITQEAVRMGSFGHDDASIQDFMMEEFHAGESSSLSVSISPENRRPGDYMTVEVAYPASLFSVFGDYSIDYTVQTSSTIRVE
ncbi:TadE/TadG family type IV pilus assembly protein [Salsuginibacillus kocurii]|uniref:TadE/TadG family type IV pilus assembly protein n=1 Tax=Salsuginibacillus kocurii TaxID=427078 RepID=UPI0003638E6A|nr:TadE family protein [Salsuginibacillus kocurii]